jgi:putative ABC transport system permease protein
VFERLKYRWRCLFDKTVAEKDLDAELRSHIQHAIAENMSTGMNLDDARRAALRELGGIEQIKEECRDVRGTRAIESFLYDARFAFRSLRKRRGTSIVIVLILGFGMGVSGSLFSVIDGAFLHPFGYTDLKRFVALNQNFPRKDLSSYYFSAPEYQDVRTSNHVFVDVGAIREFNVNLTDTANPERVLGCAVTANMFKLAGDPPIRGRTFRPEEDRPGGEKVVVISYRLWQRRYFGNPAVLNSSIKLNGERYTVIGIAPRRFLLWDADLWVPLQVQVTENDRSRRDLFVTALLKNDRTRDQANVDLQNLARQIEREHIATNPEYDGFHLVAEKLQNAAFKDLQPALVVLLVAVGVVIVISYSNVGNLLLTRALSRKREIGLRLALGATAGRIVRLFAFESLCLSLTGGLLGFTIIRWCAPLMTAMIPPYYLSPEAEIGASFRLLFLTLGISLAMGLVIAMAPARQAFKFDLLDSLKSGGKQSNSDWSSRRLRSALIVGEIALTLVVLIGAGLMIKSYVRLTRSPLGFDPRGVLTLRIALSETRYPDAHQVLGFYQQLLEKSSALPAVESSALVLGRPMAENNVQDFMVEGREPTGTGTLPNAFYRIVTPKYFDVTRIPLREGRKFTEQDNSSALPAVIINETMARRYWPNESPLGKRIQLVKLDALTSTKTQPADDGSALTIVGVVGDARQRPDLLREIEPEFYVPFLQRVGQARNMALMVRTSLTPTAAAQTIRQQVIAIDPEQPVYEVSTLSKIVDTAFGPKKLALALLLIFAVLSLTLATVGLYAIISNSVAERTHEIGVRMALGADKQNILALVLRSGFRLTLGGLGIGLFAAFAVSRLMATVLTGVNAVDSAVYLSTALLLSTVAVLASYFPARRAAVVDPAIALRQE